MAHTTHDTISIIAFLFLLTCLVGLACNTVETCDGCAVDDQAVEVASKSSPVSESHINPHFCITDAITSLQDFGDPGIAPENQWLAFYVKAPELRQYAQSRLLAVSAVERVCLKKTRGK